MTGQKIAERQLSAIVADIKVALRHDTKNAIHVGDLLREMKASPEVKHGDWLPLLKSHFDSSESTARNYIKAAEYNEAKSATVADLNLAPSVLYELARGNTFATEVEERILKAAETERVDMDRALEIDDAWLSEQEPEPKPEPEPDPESEADDDGADADEVDDELEKIKEEEAEADAVLDGPSPDLPAPEPQAPSPKEASSLSSFEEGVELLRKVMTQPATKFTTTYIAPSVLESAADFLRQVAATKEKKAA
jgi:hypothetical protein